MFDTFSLIKLLILTTISFVVTIAWTPLVTNILYKYKLGKQIRDQASAPIFSKLHAKKSGTPTMGGVLIWGTTLLLAIVFALIWRLAPESFWGRLNFLTRSQTLLPLGALVASALVGLLDDYYNVRRIGPHGGGLRMRYRLLIYTLIAAVGGVWFFFKLDWDVIHLPFLGDFNIGWWYLPIFIFIIVATAFSVNETDGLDGLAGGVLLTSFGAYAVIALLQGRGDLAVFCGVIGGALLAFLWFNINPARFFMGDTGAMSLGVTLGIVAMLTNAAFFLPVIGLVFMAESVSVILQITSKKIRQKKIFLSAPLHHHFEAIGWPEPKIVMRFWVIAMVSAALGVALFLLDRS
ncbi:phospho-N-acetylmuramoyl-pentapeptide-transferase [Candidatus Uhrbacteria bacterium]|nr:phospho-N-acetylmuramoyl-pentapeptide-transferase [Candidatus Uhrbacteria bacterium]